MNKFQFSHTYSNISVRETLTRYRDAGWWDSTQLWGVFQFPVRWWQVRKEGVQSSIWPHCGDNLAAYRTMTWHMLWLLTSLRFRAISHFKATTLHLTGQRGDPENVMTCSHSWCCQTQEENQQPDLIHHHKKTLPLCTDSLPLRPRMLIPNLSDRHEIPMLG